jgi:polar amino acid transport system substrate-binding protein
MMERNKVIWSAAAVLVCFLCLAGCGQGGDNSLQKIKKAGVVKIAMSPGYPPFSYYNAKQELIGFDVAVAGEIARRLGVEAKIVAVPWQDIIKGLNAGDYEAILGSMAITEERKKAVAFSVPYYYARSEIMVSPGSPVKSAKDLKTRTVGVLGDSTFENDAKALGVTRIKRYNTCDETFAALKRQEVDAVITDDVVGMYAKNKMGLAIEPVGEPLSSDSIAIAVRKGDNVLLKTIDGFVHEMQKDGTLRRLGEAMASNKHGGPAEQ